MSDDSLDEKKKKAREMLISGKTDKEIKDETGLRPKEISRIQQGITNHF
ncbi:hypothetical protein CLRAG_04400 [Clostridium ragsdalei P11]|uniref:Uncharacterized protein n=1 Tax=Clostridium ragsdalei P11 TaxID=1353534 RepID=A0A1A6B2R3_9CLOT|nr:hypothetical protein [Clostridium ragsdalei]OBR96570.1 hypothetical protein CLRAG_04400 [Clostridium ragsdalei P11]